MSNTKNLRSLSTLPESEFKEVSRRGGIASGKARQDRKKLRQELSEILRAGNTQEKICTALVDRAMSGDTKAFSIIRDTVGEKPAQDINVSPVNREEIRDHLSSDQIEEIKALWVMSLKDGESERYAICDLLSIEDKREAAKRWLSEVVDEAKTIDP